MKLPPAAGAWPARTPRLWRNLLVIRNPAFGLLWTGQLLSNAGSWLLVVAVPVYVLQLTGSAREAGLAFVAEVVPVLLIGPVAGVFADRWRHRATMIAADLARAACVAAMMFVARPGQVALLLALVFAENCAGAFFDPAHSALQPAVTGRGRDLSTAGAWYSVSSGLVRLAAAPAGGALYVLVGFRPLAAMDAVSYLASAALVAVMPAVDGLARPAGGTSERGPAAPSERAGEPGPGRVAGELRHGIRELLADPVLRPLLGISALFLLGNGALTALLVPYVVTRLHARASYVGVLFSALGAGYLLSAWAGRRAADSRRLRRAVAVLLAVAAAAFAVFFNDRDRAVCLLAIGLIGLAGGGFLLVRATVTKWRAAAGLVGRVSAAFGAAEMAATLAGAALASGAVTPLGLTATLNCSVAVVGVAAALTARLPAETPRRPSADPETSGPPSCTGSPRARSAALAEARGQQAVGTRRGAVQPGREPQPAGHVHDRQIPLRGADDRGGDPVGRDGSREAPQVGLAPAAEERGLHDSRQHDRHADALLGELVAEAFREHVEAGLGGGVDGLVPDAGRAGDGGHEHHPARSARGHGRREEPGQLDRRQQVQRDEFMRLGLGQLADRPGPARAGIADQQIHPAGRVQRRLHELLRAAGRGQVGRDPGGPGLRGDGAEPLRVAAGDDEPDACRRQCDGGSRADAGGSAGHQRDNSG
jgi:predicted MFS family arabinose efflux permease